MNKLTPTQQNVVIRLLPLTKAAAGWVKKRPYMKILPEDAEQIAAVAICKAVMNYNPDLGSLIPHVKAKIWHELRDAAKYQVSIVHIPPNKGKITDKEAAKRARNVQSLDHKSTTQFVLSNSNKNLQYQTEEERDLEIDRKIWHERFHREKNKLPTIPRELLGMRLWGITLGEAEKIFKQTRKTLQKIQQRSLKRIVDKIGRCPT